MVDSILLRSRRVRVMGKIGAWQNGGGGLVHGGGLEAASFATSAAVGVSTFDYITAVDMAVARAIRQDGYVYGAKFNIPASSAGQIKFKVFRKNGAVFDFVGESELVAFGASAGLQSVTFANPIPCRVGDYFGYATPRVGADQPKVSWKGTTGGNLQYSYADVVTSGTFTNSFGTFLPCIEALVRRPYLAITGDSLAIGYPENTGFYDVGVQNTAHDPGQQLRRLLGNLQVQNHGSGGKAWDWVQGTGMVSALAVTPRVLIVHCGANDASGGRLWSAVQANMDAVRAACVAAGVTLVVDEVAPMTNQSDAVSAAMRALNDNYATWCAANGVRLVRLHDAFGQVRASTGFLDDIAAVFEAADHAHFSLAGKARQAQFWMEVL